MFPIGPGIESLLKLDIREGSLKNEALSKLKPGDVLKGVVTQTDPSKGIGIARFGGQNIPIPLSSGLSPGQQITAEVVKVSYQVILRLVTPEAQVRAYQGAVPTTTRAVTQGTGAASTLVLDLPAKLQSDNILSLTKPGDIISGTVVKSLGPNQSIIQFDGVDFAATSTGTLITGQTVTARLERTIPQVMLKVIGDASPKKGRAEPVQGQPVRARQASFREVGIRVHQDQWKPNLKGISLREGQLVEVRALGPGSGDRTVIDIAGRRMEATISGTVRPGQTVLMSVDSLSQGLILRSIHPDSGFQTEKAAGFIRDHLPAREPIEKVLGQLTRLISDEKTAGAFKTDKGAFDGVRNALNQAVVSRPDQPDPANISRLLNSSGLNYDAAVKAALERGAPPDDIKKMAVKGDLKGELMQLESLVEEKLTHLKGDTAETRAHIMELKNFGNALRSAVNQIELAQVMNAVNQREGGTVFFQVPYLTSEGETKTMDVFVKRNREGKEGKKGEGKNDCNVTLLLDMTNLGSIRTDIHIQKNSLRVKVLSRDQDVVEFITGRLPDMESEFKDMGYRAMLECNLTKKEEAPPHMPHEKTPIEKLGILDVKV